jgi:hypothetical protein
MQLTLKRVWNSTSNKYQWRAEIQVNGHCWYNTADFPKDAFVKLTSGDIIWAEVYAHTVAQETKSMLQMTHDDEVSMLEKKLQRLKKRNAKK